LRHEKLSKRARATLRHQIPKRLRLKPQFRGLAFRLRQRLKVHPQFLRQIEQRKPQHRGEYLLMHGAQRTMDFLRRRHLPPALVQIAACVRVSQRSHEYQSRKVPARRVERPGDMPLQACRSVHGILIPTALENYKSLPLLSLP
jgi:hypothetical protein